MGEFFAMNTLSNFAIAAAVFAVVVAGGIAMTRFAIFKIRVLAKQSENKVDDVFVVGLETLDLRFYTILAAFAAVYTALYLPEKVEAIVGNAFAVFLGIYILLAFFKIIDFFSKVYADNLSAEHAEIRTLIPSIRMLIKVITAAFAAVFILSNMGIDVTALVAGLGIGGLAAAFAFQKILADLFSTFVIFFDKPFSVGESITVDDISGTVEKVGLKTTHIRAFSGERIVVSNETLANSTLHNLADYPSRKATSYVPVVYDTTKEQLERVPTLIREVVEKNEKAEFGFVSISHFGEHAIMFELVYRMHGATFDEYVTARHKIHLEIMDSLENNNIELGYPIELALRKNR